MARQFGSVKQLPSGRWQASHPDPNAAPGTRGRILAPETYPDEKSARKWLTVQEAALLTETWKPAKKAVVADAPMFTDYAERYIEERRIKKTKEPLSQRTKEQYEWLMKTYLVPQFGKQRLDQITPAQVKTWVTGIKAVSAGAQAYSLLGSIMRQAANHDVIVKSPCREDGAGTAPKRSKKITVISLAQLAELVAALPEQLRAPVQVMTWGGLRYGEMAGLQRGDIDGQVVTIRRGAVRTKQAKGMVIKTPKSEAGVRIVLLPPGVAVALADHLDRFVGAGDDALVMPSLSGTPLSPTTFAKQFKPAAEKIGVPELSAHPLRHAGLTRLKYAGATDIQRLAMAGHTTEAVNALYQHETPEQRAALLEKLAVIEAKG